MPSYHDVLFSFHFGSNIEIERIGELETNDLKSIIGVQYFQDDGQFLEETDIFVPPDGGYGWFVALGAFIALMWTSGTVTSSNPVRLRNSSVEKRLLNEFFFSSVGEEARCPRD